jgi:hypothetical protein
LKLWFQHEYRNKPNRCCYEHQKKKSTSCQRTHTGSRIMHTTWSMYSTDYYMLEMCRSGMNGSEESNPREDWWDPGPGLANPSFTWIRTGLCRTATLHSLTCTAHKLSRSHVSRYQKGILMGTF